MHLNGGWKSKSGRSHDNMIKWDKVTAEHVFQAIERLEAGDNKFPPPRNTFLVYNGKQYPAKHIRGMAYEIACGVALSKDDYSGGDDTERFLTRLGFTIKRTKPKNIHNNLSYTPEESMSPQNSLHLPSTKTYQNADQYTSGQTLLSLFDWRSFEIEFQRIRLNYIKWLFYFTPPREELFPGLGKGKGFQVFESYNGNSFSLSPSGYGIDRRGKRMPPGSYECNQELELETTELKSSLDNRVKELHAKLNELLVLGDYSLLWAMLQNFFWIKLGLHEFITHQEEVILGKERDPIYESDIRQYIEVSLRNGVDLQKSIPTRFSSQEIRNLITGKMKWNRYSCCSFDCGPIAWGKGRYITYSEIANARTNYNNANYEGFAQRKPAPGRFQWRGYAIRSLENIYEFGILYHRDLDSLRFRDFTEKKEEIRDVILKVQTNINQVIKEEGLPLRVFDFVP